MKQKTMQAGRWWILVAGVFTMLFAGVLYAWSIFKAPLAEEFGIAATSWQMQLNYTLTISFFCLGGFLASRIAKRIGTRGSILLSGALAGLGFVTTGLLRGGTVLPLYVTYALCAGLGIGVAYITIISSVNAWFPDRRGLSSGALMMGFGASTLLLGNLADRLFDSAFGWRKTYVLFGILIAAVLCVSAFIVKKPAADAVLPQTAQKKGRTEEIESRDYTPREMLHDFTFWRAFLALVCLTAVGSAVISFAKDLSLSVGAEASLATSLVGVLAVCNGAGRIATGAVFDRFGWRFTMIGAGALTVLAAGVTLLAVCVNSLPLCVVGLCLTGLSYGTSPTVSSAFTATFYGQKHFATNLGISNFNLMLASFIATACALLQTASGGYAVSFVLLFVLSVAALVLNAGIKRP